MAANGIFQNGCWSCGFDFINNPNQLFGIFAGVPAVGTTNLRFGSGQNLFLRGPQNDQIFINYATNLVTHVFGIALYNTATQNITFPFITFFDATANNGQNQLGINTSNQVVVARGGSSNSIGTVLATSATVMQNNTWNYFEILNTVSTTVGVMTIRMNGTQILTFSGNTQNTANAYVNRVYLAASNGGTNNVYYDDWYMLDTTGAPPLNTFLGDVRVRGRFPTADSANPSLNAFGTNPSQVVGQHFQNVNTFGSPGTAYNFDANANDRESYRVAGASGVTTIFFTNTWVNMEKDDAASRNVAITSRNNNVDSIGATIASPSSYTLFNKVDTTDPNTGLAWTPAGFGQSTNSNAEFGLKVIS